MDNNDIITIYTNVFWGVGLHGDFLKTFALAYIKADGVNREILKPVAEQFIDKFQLNQSRYLEGKELISNVK